MMPRLLAAFLFAATPVFAQQPTTPEVQALQSELMQQLNAKLQCTATAITLQQENAKLRAEIEAMKKAQEPAK